MVFKPGTSWGGATPEILCKGIAGSGSTLSAALAGLAIGGIPGAVAGAVLGSFASPAVDYALCGGYPNDDPISDNNRLPEPNRDTTLFLGITKVSVVPLDIRSIAPDVIIDLPDEIYPSDATGTNQLANTRFPLYLAVSVRDSIISRKFGCALHEPITKDPLVYEKCSIPSNSPVSDEEKENTAGFLLGDKESNSLAVGVAILSSKVNKNDITTGLVTGPTDLAFLATSYSAMNNQLITDVQTRVHESVRYDNCTVNNPTVNLGLAICSNCDSSLDPYTELTVTEVEISNNRLLNIKGFVDGRGFPLLQVALSINGILFTALPSPFSTNDNTTNDPNVKNYSFSINVSSGAGVNFEGNNIIRLFARSVYSFNATILNIDIGEKDSCFVPIRNLKDTIPGGEGYKTQLQIIFKNDKGREVRYITIPNPKPDLTAEQIKSAVGSSINFGNVKCEVDMIPYGYIRYYANSADEGRQVIQRLSSLSQGQIKTTPKDSFRASTRDRVFEPLTGIPTRAIMFIFESGKEPQCKRFNIKPNIA